MRLFQNAANALALWLRREGYDVDSLAVELYEIGERRQIGFYTEPENVSQAEFEQFLEDEPYVETHFTRPRIQPAYLARLLDLPVPTGDQDCQRHGCCESGTTYFITPSGTFDGNSLYCSDHADRAADNFTPDRSESESIAES